jgi:hypothetical protein
MALTAAGRAFAAATQAAQVLARRARYAGIGCTEAGRLHR